MLRSHEKLLYRWDYKKQLINEGKKEVYNLNLLNYGNKNKNWPWNAFLYIHHSKIKFLFLDTISDIYF